MTMDKKHACLSAKGAGPGCQNCNIMKYGYCHIFLDVLNIKTNILMKDSFFKTDREDVISEYVIKIQKSIHQFKGTRIPQFRAWANIVFKGVKDDDFRKSKAKKRSCIEKDKDPEDPSIKIVPPDPVANVQAEEIIEILLYMIEQQTDPSGCCQLFINYYQWSIEGIKQKEMAVRYQIEINTFNQRMSRCRKKIATILNKARDKKE